MDNFKQQSVDKRWPKQLGDFGEQLCMFLTGRYTGKRVALIDHVGADVIATDLLKDKKKYAISVKTRSLDKINFVFKQEEADKLVDFSNSFDLIPQIALVFINKSMDTIRYFKFNLQNAFDMCNDESIPFFEFRINKKNEKEIYFKYKDGFRNEIVTNEHIEFLELNISNTPPKIRKPQMPNQAILTDGRWPKQFGDFCEYLTMFIVSRVECSKVAHVDHTGADLIASYLDNDDKFAISVKGKILSSYEKKEKIHVESALKYFSEKDTFYLDEFSNKFGLTSKVSIVIVDPDLRDIHIFLFDLEYALKQAKKSKELFPYFTNNHDKKIVEKGFNFMCEKSYFKEIVNDPEIKYYCVSINNPLNSVFE